MTYADFFSEIKNKFMGADVSDIKEHLAYQFNIKDEEAGGIFYVEVKDGQLFVEPYEYYDRDAMFTASPDTLKKIAEGKMDPIWAFTMQKLKVEGNIDKALRLKEIIDLKQKQTKDKGLSKLGDIKYKTKWYPNGATTQAMYLTVMHRPEDNGLDFNFEHQTAAISRQTLEYFYYYMCKIMFKGVEKPSLTVGEIIKLI